MRSKTRDKSVAQQREETPLFAVFNQSECIRMASQLDAMPLHGVPRPAQANASNPDCFLTKPCL